MRYTQLTDTQVRHMLGTIGVESMDALFAPVSADLRLKRPLGIPEGVSEQQLLQDIGALAAKNRKCADQVCFLGAGAYDHFIPTVVDAMSSRGEFVTAYTPYQAEASQGILQMFYEFQTMICQLTGMDVANASLYEVASATAEAVVMAAAATKRSKVLVAASVHPDTLQVLMTYGQERGIELIAIPSPHGVIDEGALSAGLADDVAAVVVQSPNFFGCVERLDRIAPAIQACGALAIISTDPIASGLLAPPGAFGVDIVVGEGQPLGLPLMYGGPYLGFLAGKEKYLRKMPGRVVGMAQDRDGRRGFCLALQTREQHIKRERATSNVCTNQGLMACRASIYLAAMGRCGIEAVAKQCFDKAHYAAQRIAALGDYQLRFDAPFFKEFAVKTTRPVEQVLGACREKGILAGVPLGRFDERLADSFLVAVTEKRTKAEIDALVDALS